MIFKVFRFFVAIIVGIPNAPFFLMLIFYLYYRVLKNTNITEWEFIIKNSDFKKEVKKEMKKLYPYHFMVFVAFIFYTQIVFIILN